MKTTTLKIRSISNQYRNQPIAFDATGKATAWSKDKSKRTVVDNAILLTFDEATPNPGFKVGSQMPSESVQALANALAKEQDGEVTLRVISDTTYRCDRVNEVNGITYVNMYASKPHPIVEASISVSF